MCFLLLGGKVGIYSLLLIILLIPLGLEVRSSTNPDVNKKRTKAKTTNEEAFPPTWDR